MKGLRHLRVEEVRLLPAEEWVDSSGAWRFVRVRSGAAYWLGDSAPRSLAEHEMLVAAPALAAVVRASQLNEVVLQGFSFSPDLMFGLFTIEERRYFDALTAEPDRVVRFFPSTHSLTQRFAHLTMQTDSEPDLSERVALLQVAVAFFTGKIPEANPAPVHAQPAQQRFQQLMVKMPEAEFIHYSMEQLSELCGCGPRHFNRMFHQHFGESPRLYQTRVRLLKARNLLSSTDQNIKQVALDCGYRSLSLFNSLFKRRFGMSSSSWREKAAAEPADTFQTSPQSSQPV